MLLSPTLQGLLTRRTATLVLTGAGISAESGLATFRGPGGMWEGRDPTQLATPAAFADDPLTVWRFYDWRRRQAREAQPNAAHLALARWEAACPEFKLVTQNVDGLHERAGSASTLRLHGSLWQLRCVGDCGERSSDSLELGPLPPRCECGEFLRPGVVWFGEALDGDTLQTAAGWAEAAALVIVIGTSSMVYPAAGLPRMARATGAHIVEINPERTALSESVDEYLSGNAGDVVPQLWKSVAEDAGIDQ